MNLTAKADEIRYDVIKVAVKNKAGHLAPSLSCVDILVALYYEVMRIDDICILSKGHGCYGLYAILADKGLIPRERWEYFELPGCAEKKDFFGIHVNTGSLGHGLPIATGIAFGHKAKQMPGQVYCIVGDGEMQEGSCWEALIFASKHKLTNLTVIVDKNGLQAMDWTTAILDNTEADLRKRLKGFFQVIVEGPGHSISDIVNNCEYVRGLFAALICNTTKGYGLNAIAGKPEFHYRVPSQEELHDVLSKED